MASLIIKDFLEIINSVGYKQKYQKCRPTLPENEKQLLASTAKDFYFELLNYGESNKRDEIYSLISVVLAADKHQSALSPRHVGGYIKRDQNANYHFHLEKAREILDIKERSAENYVDGQIRCLETLYHRNFGFLERPAKNMTESLEKKLRGVSAPVKSAVSLYKAAQNNGTKLDVRKIAPAVGFSEPALYRCSAVLS